MRCIPEVHDTAPGIGEPAVTPRPEPGVRAIRVECAAPPAVPQSGLRVLEVSLVDLQEPGGFIEVPTIAEDVPKDDGSGELPGEHIDRVTPPRVEQRPFAVASRVRQGLLSQFPRSLKPSLFPGQRVERPVEPGLPSAVVEIEVQEPLIGCGLPQVQNPLQADVVHVGLARWRDLHEPFGYREPDLQWAALAEGSSGSRRVSSHRSGTERNEQPHRSR